MEERGINEVELRAMLYDAGNVLPDLVEGRFIVHSRSGHREWAIVLEPDHDLRRLVVITAFAVD